MKVRNHELNTVTEPVLSSSNTALAIKPEPKENYTVTFERSVLPDDFDLSTLPANSTVDIWLTKPPMPKKPEEPPEFSSNVMLTWTELRDLGGDDVYVPTVSAEESEPAPYFATAAKIGIEAVGPQEDILYGKEPTDWTPVLEQHTNFSIVQKELKITTSPPYVGGTLTVPLNPRECGDLLSNMYFTCNLPPNINYTNRVGRALFKKVELYFNEFLIQQYDDNWATIHDELFHTADEALVLDQILDGSKLIVPLKFFFCEKGKYLPLCAIFNQTVYIKLYFNPQAWFTDYPYELELTNPALVFDQVFLTQEERNYYLLKKHEYIIPHIETETPKTFTTGEVSVDLSSANFNVNMATWLIRNLKYEETTSSSEYQNRYSYGYVSPLVNSYTNFVNWRGQTVNYIQVIDYVRIFINNRNILDGLTGDLYYLYKQPLEHGLSVPDKTVYTYCFSTEPKNPVKRGDFDFRTVASKTTKLTIKFSDLLLPQLAEQYNLYMYYYGYKSLLIDKGFGVIQF